MIKYNIGQSIMQPINAVNLKGCGIFDKKPNSPATSPKTHNIKFNMMMGKMSKGNLLLKSLPRLLTQAPFSKYLILLNLVSMYGATVNAEIRQHMLSICTDMHTVSKTPKYTIRFQKLSLLKRAIIKFMAGFDFLSKPHFTGLAAKNQRPFVIDDLVRDVSC